MLSKSPFLSLLILLASPLAAQALSYSEAVGGDFSDSTSAPTNLGTLDLGSNTISGTSTAGATLVFVPDPHFPDQDVDVFSFTIAPGQRLDSINLTSVSLVNNEGHLGGALGDGAFLGLEAGASITNPLSPAGLLGNTLVGILPGRQAGDDLLIALGALHFPGSIGFSGPLAAGEYTLWWQEGPTDASYAFDLNVSVIPEPSTALLMGLGLSALAGVRRR
jgi:hypothetical protein